MNLNKGHLNIYIHEYIFHVKTPVINLYNNDEHTGELVNIFHRMHNICHVISRQGFEISVFTPQT